ncbi:MAG: arylsulfotransferase family protein [Halioglobus sp.]
MQNFQAFSKGDPTEKKTTLLQKFKNDLGLSPDRWTHDYPPLAIEGAAPLDYAGFTRRAEPPYVFVDPNYAQGYRVIAGVLNLPDTLWGAVLLNSDGEVVHDWQLTTRHLEKDVEDHREALYGMHVFPDGSIIFNMQEYSGGLVKVDACSNVVWNLKGKFHHAVSPDEHGYFWTFTGSQVAFDQNLARVSVETGEIDRVIDMKDVRTANPDLHIWQLQDDSFKDVNKMKQSGNMSHGNAVAPLPADLADRFPGFAADDLVISYATTNLVFVLDPKTLKVKWWRVGIAGFQHDPDWEPDGKLVIYSNNRRSGAGAYSSIVATTPSTNETEVIFRGDTVGFSSPVNGRHQLTPFGTRMITSSRQGWAFEVDNNGSVVFSFVNNADLTNKRAMFLSSAWHFSEDYFEKEFWQRCSKDTQG